MSSSSPTSDNSETKLLKQRWKIQEQTGSRRVFYVYGNYNACKLTAVIGHTHWEAASCGHLDENKRVFRPKEDDGKLIADNPPASLRDKLVKTMEKK